MKEVKATRNESQNETRGMKSDRNYQESKRNVSPIADDLSNATVVLSPTVKW
jgi:hypothetical protein